MGFRLTYDFNSKCICPLVNDNIMVTADNIIDINLEVLVYGSQCLSIYILAVLCDNDFYTLYIDTLDDSFHEIIEYITNNGYRLNLDDIRYTEDELKIMNLYGGDEDTKSVSIGWNYQRKCFNRY